MAAQRGLSRCAAIQAAAQCPPVAVALRREPVAAAREPVAAAAREPVVVVAAQEAAGAVEREDCNSEAERDRIMNLLNARPALRDLAFATIAIAGLLLPGLAAAAEPTGQPKQTAFTSPDDAMKGLVAALRTGNTKAVETILGPGSRQLLTSGDATADNNAREQFLAAYDEGSKTDKDENDNVIFEVGKDEWPFPIPVVMADGRWRFDSKAGAQEIINRRIGANELNTINVCLAYVDAQREYASVDRNHDGYLEYAQKFMSSPEKRDGLYWPAPIGEEDSPMGPLLVTAQAKGYRFTEGKPTPYYGYYYRILTAQGSDAPGGAMDYVIRGHMIGGFALVAYPASYGSSGVMTFIVNYEGDVYQKNLGPKTTEIAEKMKLYDPDSSWTKVDLQQVQQAQ
jgi:hypothetical protein